MRIRPLNDTVIIESEGIKKYQGSIALPDKNTEEKVSPYATVVSWGSGCKYKYKTGDRIAYNQFYDKPFWISVEGKKYRIIKEHYIHFVYERT